MKNLVVTAGETFTDIDAFACAIAYTELLRLQNIHAEAVFPGILNHSITPTIRSWNVPYKTAPSFKKYDTVVVDVSEPAHVAKCAPLDSIKEVYDHRYGFQDFWKEKLGNNAHIEPVGACTTLIWEEFKKRGFEAKISTTSANLLVMGTVSNTLDFGAQVTDKRDIRAFEELQKYSDLDSNWKEVYFREQEEVVAKEPAQSILNDTKALVIPGLGFTLAMGQMELWDSKSFMEQNIEEIKKALRSVKSDEWFMSLPSISEKRNYLYTESVKVKELLTKLIGASFNGHVGVTKKLWLRKEVRKKLFEMTGN
jgi:inorganic pyrophosphatase/exopolyphosphatase